MAKKDHTYTLGIEEEFAIIDPETRELRSHIQEILEGGKVLLKEQIKPEMHQSVVELGTEICDSIEHAPAHRNSGRVRIALRVRRLLQAAGQNRLHRQSQENLVGHSASSVFRHARSARL